MKPLLCVRMKTSSWQTVMHSIVLMAVSIWIGFVCAISFMEAWLKFQAPNVSLSIGLGIGKLVFAALNKIEWMLEGIVVVAIFLSDRKSALVKSIFLCVILLILVLQTSWLLPSLNERADNIIQGVNVPSSSVHFYYIFLEFIKVFSLCAFCNFVIGRLVDIQERKTENR